MPILENEIRIGNYFEHNASWCYRSPAELKPFQFQWEYNDWYALGESTLSLDDCSAIPLTPEWLRKFGFHKHRNAWVQSNYTENNSKFYYSIWSISDEDFSYNSSEFPIELKFVHELQNHFYWNTKTELTLKPIDSKP